MSTTLNIYYVYAYIRKSSGTPYYIGKGKADRAFNKSHSVSVPKDKQYIVFLETNLTDVGALALERRMIRWWGRKDNNTGILINRTDGGDGAAGAKFSEEHKLKIANSHCGKRMWTDEQRQAIGLRKKGKCGKPHTEDTKRRIAEARRGTKRSQETKDELSRPCTEEAKKKISAARMGVPRSEDTKQKIRDSWARRKAEKIPKLEEV